MRQYWLNCGSNKTSFNDLKEAAAVYKQIVYHFDTVGRKEIPELSEIAKKLIGAQKMPEISLTCETKIDNSVEA